MNRRLVAFIALAVVLAALFVRLGLWQLDRRAERRARNADIASRLAEPIVPFEQLGIDAAYRRATVSGAPDFSSEIVLTGRSRNGSPGVYLLTPMRRFESDTAVLVIRGWVYAPDAATVDHSHWREDRATYGGYVNALPVRPAPADPRVGERKLRALSAAGVRGMFPYPVSEHYLVSQDSAGQGSPARLPLVTLDEGPHLSYAIQWFAFAVIAIIGSAVAVSHARASRRAGSTGA